MTQPLDERDRRRRKPHRRGHGAAVEKRAARLPRGKSPEKFEPKFWSGQKLQEADPIAALALLSRGAVVVDDERAALEIERVRIEAEKARQDRAEGRARKAQRRAERAAARVVAEKAKTAWARNVEALARRVVGEGVKAVQPARVFSKLEPRRLRKGVERVPFPWRLSAEWWRATWPRLRAMKYRARVIRERLKEVGREARDADLAREADLEWKAPRLALVELARIYASGGLRKGKPAIVAGLELLGGGRV